MAVSIERSFHIAKVGHRHGGYHVEMCGGENLQPPEAQPRAERVPRISRLMALAIHCKNLLDTGAVADLTTMARLAHVTQPRMTQILNLNHLAPDIREDLLFLDPLVEGKPAISEKQLRRLSRILGWVEQRCEWHLRNPQV
jgi:hypothetical protein